MHAILLFLLIAGVAPPAAIPLHEVYVPGTATCDGYPRLTIDMAPGMCMGLVLGPAADAFGVRQIKSPRMLLPLANGHGWIVTDLGRWTPGQGAVWRIDLQAGSPARITRLLADLAMPHTVAFGPDGKVYIGEMSRIFRFDPESAHPQASIEPIVTGLPDNRLHSDRHPLSHFIFDANNDLLVNVGAPSDQCEPPAGATPSPGSTCADVEGANAKAVIRRYAYLGHGRWNANGSVLARGLRNSLVLIRHRSGTILQAENSYDFAPLADRPYEEINVIRQGGNYGWPYCSDMDRPTPVWAKSSAMDCSSAAHTRPTLLMPPHAAPLGAIYYRGSMFPQLRGKLLMSWHSERPTGSRVVAFDVDNKGVPVIAKHARYPAYATNGVTMRRYRNGPAAQPLVLTPGWDAKPGVRPAGAPVGLTVASDGAIWIADDRNAAILRIAVDRP